MARREEDGANIARLEGAVGEAVGRAAAAEKRWQGEASATRREQAGKRLAEKLYRQEWALRKKSGTPIPWQPRYQLPKSSRKPATGAGLTWRGRAAGTTTR